MPGLLFPCPVDHVHYMAPVQNVLPICLLGIKSHNQMKTPDMAVLRKALGLADISDPFVQERREGRHDGVNGRPIHDYVPMYFATHTPMQYVVTIRPGGLDQQQLVFFELDLARLLENPEAVVSTGNAASNCSEFFMGQVGIKHVKWEYVRRRDCYSWPGKNWKSAEVLYPDEVPTRLFTRIVAREPALCGWLRAQLQALAGHGKVRYPKKIAALAECVQVDRSHYY